jgi:hypothetical protein
MAEVVRQQEALQASQQMAEDRGVVMHEMGHSLENMAAMARVYTQQVDQLQALVGRALGGGLRGGEAGVCEPAVGRAAMPGCMA